VTARSPNPAYNTAYKIPAQWVFHANVSYQVRGLTFGAAVHNLLDRKELMGGSVPIPQSGEPRTVMANLRYEF
jgi:outer membrane receptor protein involved in Fe transport